MNSVETTAVLHRVNKAACRILRLYFYLYLITVPTRQSFRDLRRNVYVLFYVEIKFIGAE